MLMKFFCKIFSDRSTRSFKKSDIYCQCCRESYARKVPNSPFHNGSEEHKFAWSIYIFKKYRKALVKNRHAIEIEVRPKPSVAHQNDYQFVRQVNKGKYITKMTPDQVVSLGFGLYYRCTIKNVSKDQSIYIKSANLAHFSKMFNLQAVSSGNDLLQGDIIFELRAGAEYSFDVKFSVKNATMSSFKNYLLCTFQTSAKDEFTIVRTFQTIVSEDGDEESPSTKSPYTCEHFKDIKYRVESRQRMYYSNVYRIPPQHFKFLFYGLEEFQLITDEEDNLLRALKLGTFGPNGMLEIGNYQEFWHVLLWLEEVGQTLMIQRYNMAKVTVTIKTRDILVLKVPGLSEKRPSLILGDLVDIRLHEADTVYRGVIKRVNTDEEFVEIFYVDERLVLSIASNPNELLDVAFVLNRLSYERMHEGVDKGVDNGMVPFLFPQIPLARNSFVPYGLIKDVSLYNKEIEGNPEQRKAVLKILNNPLSDRPYVVFGPPGTGKTLTIVEAILQIKTHHPRKRILICAPANSACDTIAIKLIPYCNKSELIRIHSDTRELSTLTDQLREYSNALEGNEFAKMSVDKVNNFKIVVTTLILIGGNRFKTYRPDCIFIDEAAQASEPEANIAIGLLKSGKQLVLAGDPKQLGPMICSKAAEKFGFGKSLLARLMDLPAYLPNDKTGEYNNDCITMLIQNFRSHRLIIEIPNKKFYQNNLQARSKEAHEDPLTEIALYPKITNMNNKTPGNAIEFCSVMAKEQRNGGSPSYFNNLEVENVLKYVRVLKELPLEKRVTEDNIGVISPYKRQVQKIKRKLELNGFKEIEVGSTEAFQGREKRVIIISTVRAQDSLLKHDREYNLGFVGNEQRFNVAVTRAISKLIVIGCQQVLINDDKWGELIQRCRDLKTYFGVRYMERDSKFKRDVVVKLENFKQKDDQYNKKRNK